MKQEENLVPLGQTEPPTDKRRPVAGLNESAPAATAESSRFSGRKKWLIGLGLVFFLFVIIFIIPAGQLPGLRNLAWMMGLSPQDAQSVSFGRALFSWIGNGGKSLSSTATDGVGSLFDKQTGPGFNAEGPQSGLFDLAAVNASLRARGQQADGLYGAYNGLEDENRAAYQGQVRGWSKGAQQASAKKAASEVYFGADDDLLKRAAAQDKATQGSADTAGKVVKSNIVGAVTADWFSAAIAKAARQGRSDMDKGFERATGISAPLANWNDRLDAGDKPRRDLAQVWILSKASNKAQQAMLKKQLAAAGYVAMEMPQKVYDSMGEGGGLMMDGSEVLADFQETNKFLLSEEQCRTIAKEANGTVKNLVEDAQEKIDVIVQTVPGGACDEASLQGIANWKQQIQSAQQSCEETRKVFENLEGSCDGRKRASAGKCDVSTLVVYADTLSEQCIAWNEAVEAYNLAVAALQAAEKALAEAEAVLKTKTQERDQIAADLAAAKAAENPDPNTIARLEKELAAKEKERAAAEEDRDNKKDDRDKKQDDKDKKENDKNSKEAAKNKTANDFNNNKQDNLDNTFATDGEDSFFPKQELMTW